MRAEQELAVFCEGLETFFEAGLNQTIGFVLDGLSESRVNMLADAIKAMKDKSTKVKIWCVASVGTSHEDHLLNGRGVIHPVKIPPLSRPEATAVLYSAVKEFGPHLLRRPISLFMRVFKGQSGNPHYLCTLAHLMCVRPLPSSLTGAIDALGEDIEAVYASNFLPFLEEELNPDGALFPGVSNLFAVAEGATELRKAQAEMQPVERVLRLLYEAGDRGIFLADLPALIATDGGDGGIADRVLVPLMALLQVRGTVRLRMRL